MLCRKPFMAGNLPFGCGQCLPCRVNQRRIWSWRMFLESLCHLENSFVTLTYSPEKLPSGGSLVPRHVQLFLKRLRRRVDPLRFRFFLCGEYGDQSWRPHYHLALFGVGVAHARVIEDSWSLGHVAVFEFNELTAQYIAGYVVKKLTFRGHPNWEHLAPEFSRMSLRPGIGALAMEVVRDQLFTSHGVKEFSTVGDVPHSLRLGRKHIPLGRYLRRRLRSEIGMDDAYAQALTDKWSSEKSAEVLALLQAAGEAASLGSVTSRQVIVDANMGRIRSMEARFKISHSRGRTL